MESRPYLAAWLVALSATTLSACVSVHPPSSAKLESEWPKQWQAALPHQGQASELVAWWQQFHDPLLLELQSAAQSVSVSMAAAQSRIAQARATKVAVDGGLLPTMNAVAEGSRGRPDNSRPLNTSLSAGVRASWETTIDVGVSDRLSARARMEQAQVGWHEARVAVAAEVAHQYLGLRACEAHVAQLQLDAHSRSETARLTELSAKAGFQSPAYAALARASAAQGHAQAVALQTQCDTSVKALVALTAWDEPALRDRLSAGHAQLPRPAELSLGPLPADVLSQRPDVYRAAREWVAASADVAVSEAARLPRLKINGWLGTMRFKTSSNQTDGRTWSIGPVSLSLPLFDGGLLKANVETSRTREEEAGIAYRAQVRTAVREVEEALLQLESTQARQLDAQTAVEGFDVSYQATETRFKNGLANLFELEDARRASVQARIAHLELQRERVAAWIALYRAAGGGWSPPEKPGLAATLP